MQIRLGWTLPQLVVAAAAADAVEETECRRPSENNRHCVLGFPRAVSLTCNGARPVHLKRTALGDTEPSLSWSTLPYYWPSPQARRLLLFFPTCRLTAEAYSSASSRQTQTCCSEPQPLLHPRATTGLLNQHVPHNLYDKRILQSCLLPQRLLMLLLEERMRFRHGLPTSLILR